MKTRAPLSLILALLLAILGAAAGCNKAPNDAAITSDIQSKLSTDSGLQDKQISVQAAQGTVTLSGNVDNNTQRQSAARYAAAVPGVKQVINNLEVAPTTASAAPPAPDQAASQSQAPPPAPENYSAPPARRERHKARRDTSSSYSGQSNSAQGQYPQDRPSQGSSQQTASSNQGVDAAPTTPVASTPAPPPPPHKVTIPSGTQFAIRLVDAIDTQTSQSGQTFHATLDSPISIDGEMVVPAGYDVEGHIANLQSAGKFSGKSLVQLQLDRIKVGDRYYNIQSDQFSREGAARGKNTAEKVGGGALIGALIGGLAGGGKGAGIGAAAGAGVGGGVQAASKSQQVKLDSETVLTFHLQAPVTVVATSRGPHEGRPQLQTPNNQ